MVIAEVYTWVTIRNCSVPAGLSSFTAYSIYFHGFSFLPYRFATLLLQSFVVLPIVPILSGDRRHVYDMLCDCFSGNAKKTALVIWCVAALLSILGVWIDSVGSLWLSAMVVAAVYIALFSFGGYLGCLHVE